ncbi:aldo/keto reductase [Thermomonospora cellulosilytica]|uniref:Diketogulonate reductase-like aldo/keto reductase n=1 Tax=Thermomonospora cellulosilytica TaxID=1411118 RepID=A0A7W3MYS5_9ACTN|nr:aldo/keto reductase [Thermomonospora cellulosilytica]MBA9004356.1 diketogulonate reductase-like aldo/keto reductase [Thermomonospora cellulosilytica]
MSVPDVTLNNGVRMPQLGFGVFQVPPGEAESAVRTALEAGYRSIDTAAIYGNEEEVGKAIRASGLPREEVFVTTKLWNSDQRYDAALAAFDRSMGRLGLDVLDLYLIHWPMPARDLYMDAWRALRRLYEDGRVRAIGVSNFTVETLRRVIDESGIVPAVNQIELHPRLAQAELRAFHAEHGIATESWGPLGQGKGLLEDPVLTRLADKHRRTPAQIVLRWHLQLGCIVIPKSVTPSRIAENIDVFGFELDEEDMAEIATLDTGERLGFDPETMNMA